MWKYAKALVLLHGIAYSQIVCNILGPSKLLVSLFEITNDAIERREGVY